MKLILLGPPGAGKGTQAESIKEAYNLIHISTGDIFRKNMKENTPLGVKAKEYVDKGQLVPDEITIAMVEDRLSQEDVREGFLLDGFPRSTSQAEALDDIMMELGSKIDKVINIEVDKNILVDRVVGRRICKECGATYHVRSNPPKQAGICDKCGGELYQRADDTEETVAKRINIYEEETLPLVEYYTEKGNLFTVDGTLGIDTVFGKIQKALGN